MSDESLTAFEQSRIARIGWTVRRQFTLVGLLLALGLSTFQVRNMKWPLYLMFYFILITVFLLGFQRLLHYQNTITTLQLALYYNELKRSNKIWSCYSPTSPRTKIHTFFFRLKKHEDDKEYWVRRNTQYGVYFGIVLCFLLLLLIIRCDMEEFKIFFLQFKNFL